MPPKSSISRISKQSRVKWRGDGAEDTYRHRLTQATMELASGQDISKHMETVQNEARRIVNQVKERSKKTQTVDEAQTVEEAQGRSERVNILEAARRIMSMVKNHDGDVSELQGFDQTTLFAAKDLILNYQEQLAEVGVTRDSLVGRDREEVRKMLGLGTDLSQDTIMADTETTQATLGPLTVPVLISTGHLSDQVISPSGFRLAEAGNDTDKLTDVYVWRCLLPDGTMCRLDFQKSDSKFWTVEGTSNMGFKRRDPEGTIDIPGHELWDWAEFERDPELENVENEALKALRSFQNDSVQTDPLMDRFGQISLFRHAASDDEEQLAISALGSEAVGASSGSEAGPSAPAATINPADLFR